MSDYPTDLIPFEGLPLPQRRVRVKNPGSRPNMRKKVGTQDHTTPYSRDRELFEGKHDYNCLRMAQINTFYNKPGFPSNSRAGIPDGMNRQMAAEAWSIAREIARKDMDIIKTVFPSTDEIVEEATMTLLTNIRGPVDDSIKLASAKTLLEFYKEKPKSKRDVTVSTIDTWLASIDDKSE